MPAKIDYTGAVKRMNNGELATVIHYENSKNMTIQFEDGTIVTGVRKLHFDDGKVLNPNSFKNKHLGEVNIEVKIVEESFTSGTSYLDGELPTQIYYNKTRRITRGQFKSNTGLIINADVNAAYQIIKKCPTLKQIPVKTGEKVTKLKVA